MPVHNFGDSDNFLIGVVRHGSKTQYTANESCSREGKARGSYLEHPSNDKNIRHGAVVTEYDGKKKIAIPKLITLAPGS